MVILPELVLAAGALALFLVSLSKTPSAQTAKSVAMVFGLATFAATLFAFQSQGSLFYGAYAVDQYSQLFKALIGFSLALLLIFGQNLKGISPNVRPEYYLFFLLSVLTEACIRSRNGCGPRPIQKTKSKKGVSTAISRTPISVR